MTVASSLAGFTVTATLLTITPGLDTALFVRTLAVEGPRRAMLAGLGIALGCMGWGIAVAAGLGALLTVSQLAYDVLRWAGATYLVVTGVRLLLAPRSTFELAPNPAAALARGPNWLARGFLTNMLNPKIGVFYVSFLPQFIPAGQSVPLFAVLLTTIHAAVGLVWFGLLALSTGPLLGRLRQPKVVAWLDRATGGLFIGFGLKLALDARR